MGCSRMDEVLHTEVDDGVALVVLNRPAQRNALNSLLLAGLPAALESFDARDDVARPIARTGTPRHMRRSSTWTT